MKPLATTPDDPEQFHPKPGPDQVFVQEFVGASTGHAKRYRNIGQSPLALAYARGKLQSANGKIAAEDRLIAGDRFEKLFRTLHGSTRDSTNCDVRATDGVFLTEARQHAGAEIARVKAGLGKANYRIVEAFCGFGHSMVTALRLAEVEFHKDGTAPRIREALDELVGLWGIAASVKRAGIRGETIHPFQSDPCAKTEHSD
jgi:hypothetical protein